MESLKTHFSKKKTTPSVKAVDEKTLFFVFKKIIVAQYGERGATQITLAFFKNGVLGVRTESPLWANELFLMRGSLLDRLNKDLGGHMVSDLKLVH